MKTKLKDRHLCYGGCPITLVLTYVIGKKGVTNDSRA